MSKICLADSLPVPNKESTKKRKRDRKQKKLLISLSLITFGLCALFVYHYSLSHFSPLSKSFFGRALLHEAEEEPVDEVIDEITGCRTKFELYGGVILEILAILYLFIGIAIVSDDYFITALEIMADKLHMPSDVAGTNYFYTI